MQPDRCKGCGREVYLVIDTRGEVQMLDATAETFRLVPEREAPFTAEHSADTFVLHRAVCRSLRLPTREQPVGQNYLREVF